MERALGGGARSSCICGRAAVGGRRVLLAAIPIDDLVPTLSSHGDFSIRLAWVSLRNQSGNWGSSTNHSEAGWGRVPDYGGRATISGRAGRGTRGLAVVPAIVRDDDPNEIALIENLQREDLTALEEAEGLGAMVARYGYTHQVLSAASAQEPPVCLEHLGITDYPRR